MANEKPVEKHKHSKGVIFPFVVGIGLLVASWYYWPRFELFFISKYFKTFNGSIDPMFVLLFYLFGFLVVVYLLARILRRFSIFMGTLTPIVIYLGLCEWKAHDQMLRFISARGLLKLVFDIFSQRHW